jgi:hypothetical protein
MKTEFKSGRGGARKGAGRPPGKGESRVSDRDRRERIGIRLPAHMIEWLRKQVKNPGQVIELALWDRFGKLIQKNRKGG